MPAIPGTAGPPAGAVTPNSAGDKNVSWSAGDSTVMRRARRPRPRAIDDSAAIEQVLQVLGRDVDRVAILEHSFHTLALRVSLAVCDATSGTQSFLALSHGFVFRC